MALPLSEVSRESKDEYAQRRMEEMRIKNEAMKQRYAEVEQDRIKAEAKDCAVTSSKVLKKANILIEKQKMEDIPKTAKEREWDKGKINYWSPPKFQGFHEKENVEDFRKITKEREWDKGKIYIGAPPNFYEHREFHKKEKAEDILKIPKEREWDKGKMYQGAQPKFYGHQEFREKEKVEDIPKIIKEREWDKGKIDQDAPPKFHGYRKFQGKEKVREIPKITKEREWDKGKIYQGGQLKISLTEWDRGKIGWFSKKYDEYRSSERITNAKRISNPQEASAVSNILFSVHESYKKCLEVYRPIVQKTDEFYSYYRTIFDTTPDTHFLLFLSDKFIKITSNMISIQMSFEKIKNELEFIHVIVDNCLTSAIEFFFESAKRILRLLSFVNDLMSKCVNELESIHEKLNSKK